LRQPLAQSRIFGKPVRDQIHAALMIAELDHALAFCFRQRIELLQQHSIQGRNAVGEEVHKHRPACGDFARLKRARAFVASKVEKLELIQGHSQPL
jgi:hypothetical protein